MSPDQFLAKIAKQLPAPVYLFLGPEGYQRRLCRDALVERVLPGEARHDGFAAIDLEETSVAAVLDDAKSLSLFSRDRLIWISSAELALPRRFTSPEPVETEDGTEKASGADIAGYLKDPTPGTTVVFECSRYDFSGDDRPKLERVQKYYSAIPDVVEFRPYAPESLRFLAQTLAKERNLRLGGPELAALLDAVGGDASRLAQEMEKLALFVPDGAAISMEDLRAIVPHAAQTSIFALVNALGKSDRASALRSLDILVREGEYLPLALTFLSTQFRLALAAKEAKISSSQQAVTFFTKMGVRIWRDRAEQVLATASAFSREQLSRALELIYETDKKFREGYRNDQLVMETLVLGLTGKRAV